MKKYKSLITAILALSSQSLYAQVELLIENATILTPKNKHQVETMTNHWVAINEGRIIQVSNAKEKPSALRIIDASGKFLMPGLTDSHVHLKTMPGLLRSDANADNMQEQFLQRQGRNYLYFGVTQVIDPSNTAEGMDAFSQHSLSPDAYFCGAMPIYQGYNGQDFDYSELHQHRPYFIHQHTDPIHKIPTQQLALHQNDAPLTRMKSDGATCAKLYFEDGFGARSDIPLITKESARAVTKTASKLKLPVMAHANAVDMQQLAVDAKVNIMAHGLWSWLDYQSHDSKNALPPEIKAVLDKIIENGIAYQATLNVMKSLTNVTDETFSFTSDYETVLPKTQIKWYQSEAGQWFSREMNSGWGDMSNEQKVAYMNKTFAAGEIALRYLHENGATLLLGSDTPPAPTYASQPGLSTYQELTMMYQAGVDLVSLFAAATLNNAEAFALQQDYGSLQLGKVANLLLLNSNPLQTIAAYNDIQTVILHGKPIERDSLHIRNLKVN
ncbi:amidohydrolase family protein [Pseudoalteromonas sp. T1lg65]|uniref:amidohydrolase family protein n=1 Tax=Pseudoalteromonas sp. T1lg65 TaxID=2077101 RepID=UPI003F7B1411